MATVILNTYLFSIGHGNIRQASISTSLLPSSQILPSTPSTIAISDIVQDPSLFPVHSTSSETITQCRRLLSLQDPNSALATNPQETPRAVAKQQKELFALLSQLRGQSRDAVFRVRETKQLTAEGRHEIDRLHLQLPNLYYEQRHLSGEISACETYE